MKNKCHKTSVLKKQIREYKESGKTVLRNWSLTRERKEEFIALGHEVEICLWEIHTKHFYNIRNLNSTLLKDLHYAYKRGKNTITRRKLSQEEQDLLRRNHVGFRPLKYNIYLK